MLDVLQLHVTRAQMVEQSTGGRYDDIDAAPEGVLLRSHSDAAEHGRPGHRGVDGEGIEIVQDLRRELARGDEHQRSRGAARLVDQMVNDRQQKGGRLAAARLRGCDHVAPEHDRRNCFRLNRGGSDVAEILDCPRQGSVKLQMSKWHT